MTTKIKNSIVRFIYIVIDIACVYLSIFAACVIRDSTLDFTVTFQNIIIDQSNPFRLIFLLWIIATVLCVNANRLYQTRREVFEGIEIWLVSKSVALSSFIVIVAIYILKAEGFPRSIWLIGSGFIFLLLSIWRVFKRLFVEYLVSMGYNNLNVLVVGAGKVGTALAAEIRRRPGLGLNVIGFLDDFKTGNSEGIKILGKISDFMKVTQREFINQVFITIHHDSKVFLKLLEQARSAGIAIRVIPQGFDLTSGELFRFNIGFIPILEYSALINQRKQAGKRLFDFILGIILFIISMPLFIALGICIKIDSRGSIIYKSKRYSRQGKTFYMYKFRSMVHNADQILEKVRHKNEADGPIFKMKKDPRVTRVGQFLRKYSLDELPQILNVIKGEMSLVGPRPLPIEQIEREDLRQYKRLEVRPGITGLWQIRGRSSISFSRLIKWDIWYINKWSFWLDLYILFQTIPVVFRGKGAY